MFAVLGNSWALLLGMFLLMLGNGMQGTVLGLRGGIEAFESTTMGFVMAGYFAGFLGGAQTTPWLLRRVGHVRVFAALASLVSAAFIIFAAVVDPIAWTVLRIVVGFCYSGIYVVAESWLNESSTNENRGRTLSAYLIMQMLGIIVAQGLINVADPGGYDLFIIMSVAVSISFAPILLSASPAPVFGTTRRMSLKQLFKTSPLGCVGTFFLGAVFAAQFGMGPVYATQVGLSAAEISIFIGTIYVGGLLLQYPIGWLSDRMERRVLIAMVTALGATGCLIALVFSGSFPALVVTAFLIGGTSNPLYSLLIAHTNDFLEHQRLPRTRGHGVGLGRANRAERGRRRRNADPGGLPDEGVGTGGVPDFHRHCHGRDHGLRHVPHDRASGPGGR
jgi:MFS family permease